MDLHIEKFWMANEGIPTQRRVELHIVLQVLLLTRHPCEYHHDSFNLSTRLISSPIKLTPKPPHLLLIFPRKKKKNQEKFWGLKNKTPTKNNDSRLTREFPGIVNGRNTEGLKALSLFLILSRMNLQSFMPLLDNWTDFLPS